MRRTNEAIKTELLKAYEREIDELLGELDAEPYDFAEFEQALIGFVNRNASITTDLVQTHKDFSPSDEGL